MRERVRWVAPLVVAATLAASATALGDAAPVYKDSHAPVERRVADLLGRMSLEQKVGQMGQINVYVLQGDPSTPWDRGPLNPALLEDVLGKNMIGSILSGGGAWPPAGNDGRAWAEEVNAIQKAALEAKSNTLGIPIIYGVDAVHGHNNLSDATDFPHQIGLGATFDPGLVYRLGVGTGRAVRATGIAWSFSPVLDTERDIRWGRAYEPFGEDPFLNGVLGSASITGQQTRVAATAKHFTGYSAPDSGHDRTDATISQAELQDIHLPPFQAGIDAGVQTVMINSGSVNGEPVHASHRLLTDVLRGQLGFRGVAISDWQDVENLITKYHVAADMEDALALAVNAGMDMSMIPLDATGFTTNLLKAVQDGKVSQARIDEAVSRILTLKFRQGLFEQPYADADKANAGVEDPSDRPLARKAAQESLVLLENRGALPLRARKVLVTGPSSDSPANQLGGWTIGWQGAFDLPNPPLGVTVPEVTTLREGLEQAGLQVVWKQGAPTAVTTNAWAPPDPLNDASNPQAVAARQEAVAAAKDVDAIVVAVGESPYAEGRGDNDNPQLPSAQAKLIDDLKATGKPVIVVVQAGRPLVMNAQLDEADAALMAFLPGSEGGAAISDALTGRVNPSGRLTVSWPKAVSQIPLAYNEAGKPYDPRYPFGHGLSYTRFDVKRLSVGGRGSKRVSASADIRNSGRRDGEDVVLAFAERVGGGAPRRLVAFDRVGVGAGEREKAKLSFDLSRLASTQADGRRIVLPGTYRLTVEGASTTFTVR
jgi:beta-glucosidase